MSTASVLPSRAAVTPERGSSPVSNSKRTSTATKKITNKDAQDATRRAYAKNEKVSSDSRRTPAATSTRSQRSEQLNKALKEKDTPPTPGSSPHIPVTRKRAAETIEGTLDEEEESVEDEITTNHARDISGGSRDSANSVCLCQPEPKIKRPRNAFMLYRQHQHAIIQAQNPGLQAPDISKEIGRSWHAALDEVKNEYKRLAEVDKKNHQEKYPDYRYRPRRTNRRGSISDPATTTTNPGDQDHCDKCGGLRVPKTSTIAPTASQPETPTQPEDRLPATPTPQYLSRMNNLSLQSPQSRRPRMGPAGLHINAAASRRLPDDGGNPTSPDPKRRRYNTMSHYLRGPASPYGFSPPGHGSLPPGHVRRESLPRPADLFRTSPPNSASLMGSPPTQRQLHQAAVQSPYTSSFPRTAGWDRMSLTLPPLRTPTAANGANSQAASIAGPEAPARDRHSVEQIIMSMPFLDKVKNLRRIAPPMGAVSATQTADSKPNSTRGALVAVEGRNRKAVDSLAAWLGDLLEKSGDHNVDLMDGPKVPNGWDKVNIADYNAVIGEWHQRNKTIMDFLQHSSKIDDAGSDENENDDDATEDARSDDGEPSPTKNVGKASASDSIPVIVLKTYQLHACDRYACSIPITDVYRPPDHWLWMATLWRGILGADITIYVREIDTSSQSAAVAGESGDKPAPIGNGNAATAAAMEKEREKIGTVDIVEEEGLKCLVVHKEKGKDVEERALRRLGFELGEWVRGIANAGRK